MLLLATFFKVLFCLVRDTLTLGNLVWWSYVYLFSISILYQTYPYVNPIDIKFIHPHNKLYKSASRWQHGAGMDCISTDSCKMYNVRDRKNSNWLPHRPRTTFVWCSIWLPLRYSLKFICNIKQKNVFTIYIVIVDYPLLIWHARKIRIYHLHTLLFTTSGYPFGIFKMFLYDS